MPVSDSATRDASRRALLLLTALLVLMGFGFQGSRGLWNTDEGRYTDTALQMIDSGNYLLPAYTVDRPNISKPPMTAWIIAGAVKVLGRNSWAVRTPYALAFILTALLLVAMGRDLVPDTPWLPGLVYACSLYPFMAANVVSTDVLLTAFEALAALGFVRAFFGPAMPASRRWLALMWLGFGLAFLTKGPPGLMPLLGMAPYAFRRDGWRGVRRLFNPLGVVLFLAVGLSWYTVAILSTPGLLDYFLHYEVYDRVFTGAQGRHQEWYGWLVVYGPVLVVGSLPWWPAMARGVRAAVSKAWWRAWWRTVDARLFLVLWLAVPLLVFCLARSRLPMYLLPLFMPLSLLLAHGLRGRIDLTRTRQRLALGAWVAVLLLFKGVAAYAVHTGADNRLLTRQLRAATGAGLDYDALAIVRDTDDPGGIRKNTPWGMRLYLGKVVYGLAWGDARDAARLCPLLARHGTLLLAIDTGVAPAVKQAALACPKAHAHVLPQTWRHRQLVLLGH